MALLYPILRRLSKHQPKPYRAVPCRAPPGSGALRRGSRGALGAREGVVAGGGVRPGWRRKKGFYSSYPAARKGLLFVLSVPGARWRLVHFR
jgi:hypothetical protein